MRSSPDTKQAKRNKRI
ncbi:hypothetical protein LT628_01755 [Staphylococcus aureus]|nr:hypothetical protein [Staphylococcus aureus]MDT2001396.1 hypothetical protein [Staphylococcus aureus]